jgi:predicted DNA-binding protein
MNETEKLKQLNIRLPKPLLKKLNLIAVEMETNKERLVRKIIEIYLEKTEKEINNKT